jgi:uncharacterized membrane protein
MAKKNQDTELKSSLDFTKTNIDKMSVFTVGILGSMKFLLACMLFFVLWICWNLKLIGLQPFDPFPFPILEMSVSIFAIVLSVTVLINQNRQGRMDKIRQQVDFEVNVRAEEEITKMLSMLHAIHQKMGINSNDDKELEEMKETVDVKKIHESIDKEGL